MLAFLQRVGVFLRKNLSSVVVLLLIFILGWQLGHRDYILGWKNYKPNLSVINEQPPDPNVQIDFKLFWDTWNLISEKYIDKKALDPQKMYFGAIRGMVAAIGDPYTVFLPPEAQKSTKEQLAGAFDGVGMELGYDKSGRLVVIAPLKDTPADKAGIKPGDIIVKIDGKDVSTISLPEAVAQIRGPKGTSITINIYREGEAKPRDISLVRDTITVKSVVYETKSTSQIHESTPSASADNKSSNDNSNVETKTTKSGKTIAYIRISSFGEKTRDEWDAAVIDALSRAPLGIIVDVRNNPGGYLDDAVYIASEFLDSGAVVMQEDYQGNRQVMSVVRSGKILKLPLVVIINKGSASASEILAGAMQDRKRATLVGEQSFGKGTIQSAEDLPEGTGIHITTAKWLTPNGRWIHNIGLTPDAAVDAGTDPNKDPQLDKALEILDK